VSRQIRSESRSIYWSATAAQVRFEDLPIFLQAFSPDPRVDRVFPPQVTILVRTAGHSRGISFVILPLLNIKSQVPKVTWAWKPTEADRRVERSMALVTGQVLK
jgi:hypothetical protein